MKIVTRTHIYIVGESERESERDEEEQNEKNGKLKYQSFQMNSDVARLWFWG